MRVLLDVDTGIDDALALLYAVAEPALEVVGATAVAGNVPVEVAARNTAAVLAAAGREDVPVARGAATASTGRRPRRGPSNHGVDGLGGVAVPESAGESTAEVRGDAGALLAGVAADGPVIIAALAPMTNVSGFVGTFGRPVERPAQQAVERVVFVGGELVVEGEPEFNVGHDPAAAAVVLGSDVPTTMYAIDVFETIAVPEADVALLRRSASRAARLAGHLLGVRRGRLIGDAGALVLLAHPELFTVERRRIGVVGDRATECSDGRDIDVVVAADAGAVVEAFVGAVARGA